MTMKVTETSIRSTILATAGLFFGGPSVFQYVTRDCLILVDPRISVVVFLTCCYQSSVVVTIAACEVASSHFSKIISHGYIQDTFAFFYFTKYPNSDLFEV